MTNLFKGKTYEGTSFIIDKIYPNKKDMDAAAATDEVFVGRYVLVSYTNQHLEQDERDSIALQLQGHIGLGLALSSDKYKNYVDNIKKDNNITDGTVPASITSYDKVVYRKMCKGGEQKYEMVASLNTTANKFIKGIAGTDKILTISNDINKVLEAHLSFEIKTEEKTDTTESGKKLIEKYLVVYGKEYEDNSGQKVRHEIARLDLTEYYKDIFLAGVSWDKGNHALKFLIGDKDDPNVVTETTVTVDLMDAGNGIDIGTDFDADDNLDDGPVISINLSEPSDYENYLEVGENGLSTNQTLDDKLTDHETRIATNERTVTAHGTRITTNEGAIDTNTEDITKIKTQLSNLEDRDIIKSKPSFTITTSNMGKYEVGTVVNPTYTALFKQGRYKYPLPYGKAMSSDISDQKMKLGDNNFASGWSYTIAADTDVSFKFSATISRDNDQEDPVTSLGNPYKEGRYRGEKVDDNKVGTQTRVTYEGTGASLTGYREGCFYGTIAASYDSENQLIEFKDSVLDSAKIRSLDKTGSNYSSNYQFTFNAPMGSQAIVIAWPDDKNGPKQIFDGLTNLSTTNSPTGGITVYNRKVSGAVAGKNEKYYKVWVFVPSKPVENPNGINYTVTLG